MGITVSVEQRKEAVTVLRVAGEMTADTAAPFEAEAARAIQNGAKNLVLDLSEVPFIGSFGIRSINNVLLALHAAADGYSDADLRKALRGGAKSSRLKLANLNPHAMRVLETTGFDMYLEAYPSVEDAVASF